MMHPKADGKPGRAKISVTGFDAPRPSVVVEYVERNGRSGVARLDIPKIAVDRPQTLAAAVRAGRDGIERLDLRVKVDTEKDERDALVKRTADERVDRTMLSAEQVTAVFANLDRLRAAGLYRDALAYHDLGSRPRDRSPGSTRASRARNSSRRSSRTARRRRFPTSEDAQRLAGRRRVATGPDRPMGHADSAARGLRDPREDVGVQGGDRLQGRRELSRQGRLGDGSDAADRGVALVAGQADDAEADHRLFGAAARERSVVDQPRAARWRSCC